MTGAAATVGAVLERIADRPKTFVLDFSDVPLLDSSAAHAIEAVIAKAIQSGVRVLLNARRAAGAIGQWRAPARRCASRIGSMMRWLSTRGN